ncbi:MAG: undecaprenyl-phosphate galactose phosphotransferase WbaP [Gemmatimonadales bacterium]|nr:MAG: undecaprenyl-phosphate galactose phosphotransferase WbaP [Gemmatimonadales bacterium]
MRDNAAKVGERVIYPRRSSTVRPEPARPSVAERVIAHEDPRAVAWIERRKHWRESPPDVLNGMTYSLRSLAVSAPLLASDLAALVGALLLATAVVGFALSPTAIPFSSLFAALGIGLVSAKTAMGLYPAVGVSSYVEMRRSTIATVIVVGGFLLAGFLYGSDVASRLTLLITGMGCLVLLPLLRAWTRKVVSRYSWWSQPLLVFDSGPAARHVSDYFAKNPRLGLYPVLVDPAILENGADPEGSRIAELASEHGAVCAAFPMEGAPSPQADRLLRECVNTFPHLVIVPDLKGTLSRWRDATNLGGMVGLRGGKNLLLPGPRAVKRAMDWTAAFLISLVALPVGLAIALAVKLTSPGPIFYGQQRIGRDRKPFPAWKFRTMHPNASELLEKYLASDPELRAEWEKDHKLKNDPRVTLVGQFLRKTSLDELPQLWNILSGEMSLVGPRPIVEDEVSKYGPEFGRYLSVPPGLTGLWQVSGRNWTTYEERIELDAFYVENWSLMFDFYILARTVKAVVTGHGAY